MENFSGERMPSPQENTGEEIEEFPEDKIESSAEQVERPMSDIDVAEKLIGDILERIGELDAETAEKDTEEITMQINELSELMVFIWRDIDGHELEMMAIVDKVSRLEESYQNAWRRLDSELKDQYPNELDRAVAMFELLPYRSEVGYLTSCLDRYSTESIRSLAGKEISVDDIDSEGIGLLLKELSSIDSTKKVLRYSYVTAFESFMDKHGHSLGERLKKDSNNGEDNNDLAIFEYNVIWWHERINTAMINAIQRELDETPEFLDLNPDAEKRVLDAYKRYGLDGEDILDALSSLEKAAPRIADNYSRIERLEEEWAGGAKILRDKFGIRNFDRYPVALLKKQIEQMDDKETPYGIVMNPTSDHNGAFMAHLVLWNLLGEKLGKNGYALRIMESNGKFEVAKRLLGLDKAYGADHKISFAFIGGHGEPSSISFGGMKDKQSLLKEDLLGKGAPRTSQFFEPNPTIVLVSCSTGVEGGIAQQLSETLDAQVIAPDVDTNLRDISLEVIDGRLDFDITYREQSSARSFTGGVGSS